MQKNSTKILVVHYRTPRCYENDIYNCRSRPLYALRIGETIEHRRCRTSCVVRYRVAWIRVRLKIYRVLVVHFPIYSLYIQFISFCEILASTVKRFARSIWIESVNECKTRNLTTSCKILEEFDRDRDRPSSLNSVSKEITFCFIRLCIHTVTLTNRKRGLRIRIRFSSRYGQLTRSEEKISSRERGLIDLRSSLST